MFYEFHVDKYRNRLIYDKRSDKRLKFINLESAYRLTIDSMYTYLAYKRGATMVTVKSTS